MTTDALQTQPEWLDTTPARQGRYVLGPLLGQGGMGEVREAWDVVLRRTVALKILRAMDPVSLIRFMYEAQLQARVIHPNVCRVYDVDSGEGAPRIAMQLIKEGQTLADLADQLTVPEIIDLFARVADAVHSAHKHKLIHRDLKPSNILMERRPEGGWTPYVCDFGLAMALEEPALTYSQGLKGTPAYMAPEQIRGERHLIGPATDIYALGGTLFFALYGQMPAGACLDLEAMLGRRTGPLTLPKGPKGPLPPGLETLLRTCLEPDPDRRGPSMASLAEELRRVGRGEPILTRPRGRFRPTLARFATGWNATRLALLTAGGLALALGLLLGQRQLRRSNERRAEWTRSFALEAANLEQDFRVEKMLPIHDLRPAYARITRHMEDLRMRMAALGADAEGPGRYALGSARLLMRDFPGAREDLERAWACGDRGPEVAEALARALVSTGFQGGAPFLPAQAPRSQPKDDAAQRLEGLLRQGQGWAADSGGYARALLLFSQRDFARAAAAAQASFVDHPWRFEPAILEGLSFYALGEQQDRAGDTAGAERSYRQAMDVAERYLAMAHSEVGLHHVYLRAGRALAWLQRQRGLLAPEALDQLQHQCQEALRLDPDLADLQDDWLGISLLKAAYLANVGEDPHAELAQAQAFLEARARTPLTSALEADRALLQLSLASFQNQGQVIAGRPDPFRPATILY
jgi:serine/threonine-protein kinase